MDSLPESAVFSSSSLTETTNNEVLCDVLDDLAASQERTLQLVVECQRKHVFRRFLGAGDMAKELSRVQDDIMRQLQLGNFATNVQTTVMLTNIESAAVVAAAPLTPRTSQEQEVIPGFVSLADLKDATKDFPYTNIIGQCGFTTVYKGVLHNRQMIAIKEHAYFLLSANENRTYDAIDVFIELKQENTGRPLGYWHQVIMLLVSYDGRYVGAEDHRFCFVEDHIPNGSMEDAISGSQLSYWSSHFKVFQEIAKGLNYLQDEQHFIVHRDLKPGNKYGFDMNPQNSEYGIVKQSYYGDDLVISRDDYIAGTPGNIAPEQLTAKYDVRLLVSLSLGPLAKYASPSKTMSEA